MAKEKMAIIKINEDDPTRFFASIDEIRNATFGDFGRYGWNYDDMGLKKVGETENGEDLFESWSGFYGQKTWDEIEDLETDWHCVKYWDGNNWQIDLFEHYDEQEIDVEKLDSPSPAYFFPYVLTLENGEKVNCACSNCSGSLSPYFVEDTEY